MVHFITLEEKVEEYVPKDEDQDYVVQNLIQNVPHAGDCTTPEIKLSYEVIENKSIDGTYDNRKKTLIAGCMCGATASTDVSQGYAMAAKEQYVKETIAMPQYSANNNSVASSYY